MAERIDRSPDRRAILIAHRLDEGEAIARLLAEYDVLDDQRQAIGREAERLIGRTRAAEAHPGAIAAFIREYDLSSDEGLALMLLAEALLRIPDPATRDALIRDKLGAAHFETHLGHSPSSLVNASSRALAAASRGLRAVRAAEGRPALALRLGEPLLRQAMEKAMSLIGGHFVLGADIRSALERARPAEAQGIRHSYDMLGEAALTRADVNRYFESYRTAIGAVGQENGGRGPILGPGISIKLSALHPRYEARKRGAVLAELSPLLLALAQAARDGGIGCTIDAEEAERLELSLDLVDRLIAAPELAGWDGLGLAVQAYAKRTPAVLDWLAGRSRAAGRRLMLRLVKGAYWDSEIKRAQELGLGGYPVFTQKAATDLSFLVAARRILAAPDCFYGQFATHNAHSIAALLAFAGDRRDFEFQRLFGMGEALHGIVAAEHRTAFRVYAPVGPYRDLLAYLVRRLLENGASASFVNRLSDGAVPEAELAADPARRLAEGSGQAIPPPSALYRPERDNSPGVDPADPEALAGLAQAVAALPAFDDPAGEDRIRVIVDPADRRQRIGRVREAGSAEIAAALDAAGKSWRDWEARPVEERAACLERAAEAIAADRDALLALLVREAGKTLPAALSEWREAIDLLRHYAASARQTLAPRDLPGPTGERNRLTYAGRGIFACIAPWNFPLAIFLGQAAAALAAGNGVVAKPAEQTPLIALRAVGHLHEAGIPREVLACLPGDGDVGRALTEAPGIAGVAFTGALATARAIQRSLAARDGPIVPLIAETSGLNAMIVDSSALLAQAVPDILASAFDSAGQRCSALRCLYVQEEIADELAGMLAGAMAELQIGDPARLDTDIGPVIDGTALAALKAHAERIGRPFAIAPLVEAKTRHGTFFAPRAVWIDGIERLEGESFGPILHVVRFAGSALDSVLDAVNATGYGLTLGVMTRIEEVVERVRRKARVGNLYVNRSMIGAAVGSQPFGGEGLSGTGPKAGGPDYVRRFAVERTSSVNVAAIGGNPALLAQVPAPPGPEYP